MDVKMFDEVRLRDGRIGHIVEIYDDAYDFDFKLDNGDYELEIIKKEDVVEILG